MTTILKIGYHCFALPRDANAAAILKALSGAVQVRQCYHAEKPFEYRALHEAGREVRIEIQMVDSKRCGPANPDIDDHGQPIEKPVRRGRLLGNGEGA